MYRPLTCTAVLFPLPLLPTSATVLPAGMERLKFLSGRRKEGHSFVGNTPLYLLPNTPPPLYLKTGASRRAG